MKTWSANDIRALARQTVEGRRAVSTARGEYLKALIGTAQLEIGDAKLDQAAQRRAVSEVSQRFQELVISAIATDEILSAAGIAKKDIADERNRRINFVRTNLHAVRRWLRASGHDLMKLDVNKVTKSELLADSPPANKHALTRRRVQAKAEKQIVTLLKFLKEIAKADQAHAGAIATDLAHRLMTQVGTTLEPRPARAMRREFRKLPKAA